jgi:hypothetical protein
MAKITLTLPAEISGGGNGITNLSYIPSPSQGVVTSDTGTDATIPLADLTNAGLITAVEKAEIATALQSGDNVSELLNDANYVTDVELTAIEDRVEILENLQNLNTNFTGVAYAIWTGTGLIYDVVYPDYYIEGILYPGATEQITLDVADPTDPRQDIIAVDATGAIKITGIPSPDPAAPSVDSLTEIYITTVLITAGATTPTGVSNESIYKENTEWTTSTDIASLDFNSTSLPFEGTKNIETGAFTAGKVIWFEDSGINQRTDFDTLRLRIYLKATFNNNTKFLFYFFNGVNAVSNVLTLNNGQYGFSRTTINQWQDIIIPLTAFTFSGVAFDKFEIIMTGGNATGFKLDNIILNTGTGSSNPLQKAITSIVTDNGIANATTADDVFTIKGGNGAVVSAVGKIITITPTLPYTDENAQDAIGGILTDTSTIDFNYNDGSNTISADVKANSIDATHLSNTINTSEFVNDGEDGINPYVTELREININGVSQDLSTDREWRTAQADTGVLTFASPGVSVYSGTAISVGAVTGYIIDNETNPVIPTYTFVNYAGATNITVTTVGSGLVSYVLLSSSGVISFQNTLPTSSQRKTHIWLGKVAHPAGVVTVAGNEPDFITSPLTQYRDMFQALGPYINDGLIPYANGANLQINITGGDVTGNGINFVADNTKPDELTLSPTVVLSYLPRTQTGTGGIAISTVDVGNYDVGGVVTVIPGSGARSTIRYIYYVPNLGFIIQYGQTWYSNITDAIAAVGKETQVIYPALTGNSILIGVLVARKDATALNDITQARFLLADKLGQIGGSSSGISIGTLQTAYDNSLVPQISPTDALGAVTIKNGRALDTSNIIVGQDIAGIDTFSVTGAGVITGSNLSGTNTGDQDLSGKQDVLISATNIKTINGNSLLGSGDLTVGGSGSTNLTYTPSPTDGTVHSDTGSDATIPLADGTNAGLLKPAKYTVLENTTNTNSGDETTATLKTKINETLAYACSDETSNLTVGVKITFRMPFAFTLSEVRASLNDAPTISSLITDIKEGGVSILSTLLSIDATEKTSTTAATPAVISDINLADDAEMSINITQIGSGNAGKGLKVLLIGNKA